jgi:hypothetical protein
MHGFNRHLWDFDAIKDNKKLVTARKYILAVECIFCVAAGLIKISILLFYRRLSSRVVSKAFRCTTWITIGFIVAYTIALTLAPILGCQPVSAFWDQVDIIKRLKGYEFHCFDEGLDLFVAGVISAAQDLLTAVLPTFLYWDLKIPARQKVALFAIFAIGYGAVALGGLRTYYSWRTFYATYDVTWSTYDIFFTTLLELHVGAFCANAPTMKVFFKHFFHDKLSSGAPSKESSRMDSAHSRSKSNSSRTGIRGKVASIFGASRSKAGYISNTDTSVSVDAHGGVHVQKEIDIIRFPALAVKPSNKHESVNTINMLNAHYYNDDIEMGHYAAGDVSRASSARSTKDFDGTDLSALPPMPQSPASPRSAKSRFSLVPVRPQEPRSPVIPEPLDSPAPVMPTHVEEDESRPTTARAPTPIPMRSFSEKRPEWQSWA